MPTDTTTSAIAKLIAEARERANKCTEGPWHFHPSNKDGPNDVYGVLQCERGLMILTLPFIAEGEFIANARTTVPALADTLEAVTRERDMLAARDLGNVRDGVELLDLNSSLTADLKAVTKERDALREALEGLSICQCVAGLHQPTTPCPIAERARAALAEARHKENSDKGGLNAAPTTERPPGKPGRATEK